MMGIFLFVLSQILTVDSIIDGGAWVNPESVITSDNLYASAYNNEAILIMDLSNPEDTLGYINSVKVFLEQHVSDPAKANWYVVPIVNGISGASSPRVPGTLNDSVLTFDISNAISTWNDILSLSLELHTRKGTGAPPEWFADYLYVFVYTTPQGIEESPGNTKKHIVFTGGTLVFNLNCEMNKIVSIGLFNKSGVKIMESKQHVNTGINTIELRPPDNLPSDIFFISIADGTGDILQIIPVTIIH